MVTLWIKRHQSQMSEHRNGKGTVGVTIYGQYVLVANGDALPSISHLFFFFVVKLTVLLKLTFAGITLRGVTICRDNSHSWGRCTHNSCSPETTSNIKPLTMGFPALNSNKALKQGNVLSSELWKTSIWGLHVANQTTLRQWKGLESQEVKVAADWHVNLFN